MPNSPGDRNISIKVLVLSVLPLTASVSKFLTSESWVHWLTSVEPKTADGAQSKISNVNYQFSFVKFAKLNLSKKLEKYNFKSYNFNKIFFKTKHHFWAPCSIDRQQKQKFHLISIVLIETANRLSFILEYRVIKPNFLKSLPSDISSENFVTFTERRFQVLIVSWAVIKDDFKSEGQSQKQKLFGFSLDKNFPE